MPAARITLAYFATSALMVAAKSSALPPSTS